MILADAPVFPNNAVNLIAAQAQALDPDLFVVRRPLKESDNLQSVGVYGFQWIPDETSYEMRGLGPREPTLQRYLITVQAFVKDMDEERGLAVHSVLSKMVRSMLYRNNTLRVALNALSVVMDGSTENTTGFGISRQNYVSNELSGSWLYLSTLEFWLETETI